MQMLFSNAKGLGEVKIFPTHTVRTAFGNNTVNPSGFVTLDCKIGARPWEKLKFYVKDSGLSILGRPACESLNLVQRIQQIGQADYFPLSKEKFLREYHDVFSGLGGFKREYDIQVRPDVEPKIQPIKLSKGSISAYLLQQKSRPSLLERRSSLYWINETPTGKSSLQSDLHIFGHLTLHGIGNGSKECPLEFALLVKLFRSGTMKHLETSQLFTASLMI